MDIFFAAVANASIIKYTVQTNTNEAAYIYLETFSCSTKPNRNPMTPRPWRGKLCRSKQKPALCALGNGFPSVGCLNVWYAVLYYVKVVAKDPRLLNLDDVILFNLKEEFLPC